MSENERGEAYQFSHVDSPPEPGIPTNPTSKKSGVGWLAWTFATCLASLMFFVLVFVITSVRGWDVLGRQDDFLPGRSFRRFNPYQLTGVLTSRIGGTNVKSRSSRGGALNEVSVWLYLNGHAPGAEIARPEIAGYSLQRMKYIWQPLYLADAPKDCAAYTIQALANNTPDGFPAKLSIELEYGKRRIGATVLRDPAGIKDRLTPGFLLYSNNWSKQTDFVASEQHIGAIVSPSKWHWLSIAQNEDWRINPVEWISFKPAPVIFDYAYVARTSPPSVVAAWLPSQDLSALIMSVTFRNHLEQKTLLRIGQSIPGMRCKWGLPEDRLEMVPKGAF